MIKGDDSSDGNNPFCHDNIVIMDTNSNIYESNHEMKARPGFACTAVWHGPRPNKTVPGEARQPLMLTQPNTAVPQAQAETLVIRNSQHPLTDLTTGE